MSGTKSIVWRPQQGPQHALIDCPLREIFYGGARGGGESSPSQLVVGGTYKPTRVAKSSDSQSTGSRESSPAKPEAIVLI